MGRIDSVLQKHIILNIGYWMDDSYDIIYDDAENPIMVSNGILLDAILDEVTSRKTFCIDSIIKKHIIVNSNYWMDDSYDIIYDDADNPIMTSNGTMLNAITSSRKTVNSDYWMDDSYDIIYDDSGNIIILSDGISFDAIIDS